jgi:undecaprenyl-phosphate alpha-N-acetylglucosaminyl 1-phosphatetransferase
MQNEKFVAASAITVAVTLASIFWLRPLARRIGLVDAPSERKRHRGRVPLIGGLCFFIGTIAGLIYFHHYDPFVVAVLVSGAIVVLLGLLDDLYDLSPRTRLLIQAATVVLVMAATGVYVDSAGDLFGGSEIRLYWLGIPFTVVAVVGLVNAFNMLDGIDGLAGSLSMISIAAILAFSGVQWPVPSVLLMLQLLAVALVPYLLVNLGWPDGRRIFMGDAGSMLLGFVLAWSLVSLSQRGVGLAPVDVLWCVALPVMDTIAVMYQRIRSGHSPFRADRRHLHHMLLDAGLSPRKTLALMVGSGGLMAALGYAMRDVAEGLSLLAFLCVLVAYVLRGPRAVAWLRMAVNGHHTALPERLSGAIAGLLGRSWVYVLFGKQAGVLSMARAGSRHASPAAGDGKREQAPPAMSAPDSQFDERDHVPQSGSAHDGRVRALCVLDGTPGDLEMVPIMQQLSADARFDARICVAGLQDQELHADRRSADHARGEPEPDPAPPQDPAAVVSRTMDEMGRMVRAFDPDVVLIHGESPTVLATALVAYYQEIPVARMGIDASPGADAMQAHAETNDRIINTLASLHFTSSERTSDELVAAGIPQDRITVTDHARIGSPRARARSADACVRIAEALAHLPHGAPATQCELQDDVPPPQLAANEEYARQSVQAPATAGDSR